ncbi:MerR family transcriptional regulator [Neobacillus ginsengisoli]|uniref:DNA-binding transcriptional MerR regulator n=1 Tax=Neobacillus ginsengisoli TaxID=904295 RepID=A0ABT9XPM1_9BACI|nr:cobalamin-dependent protein [Neobacillus ginsengisoli]MDQ0197485.1 DNA-binding transcriptional MerR regulator [Neobacillus ginsengisoli]
MEGMEGKYNIKAASKMLGIQPGTLRAWERRYQMIAPIRNESGHRLYTEEHIKILKWLVKKINQGFTISQAVSLLENNELFSDGPNVIEGNQITSMSVELLSSLINFKELKAQEIINSLFSLFTIEKVIFDIFVPLLEKIGELRESHKINGANEHFAFSIIRSRIGTIFYNSPQNPYLPKAVAVCSPGEAHEIGLLIFSLVLRRKGFDVVYLGSGITEDDLNETLNKIHPDFLFISCTMKENLPNVLPLITSIKLNNKNLKIGIGGYAVKTMKQSDKEQLSAFIVGQTRGDWEKWLSTRAG